MNTVPDQTKNNKGFLVLMSVLAGLQFAAGGLAFIPGVPAVVVGLVVLGIASVSAGMTYYINGQIVPLNNVVAYQPNKSTNPLVYAGGAAPQQTGTPLDVEAPLGTYAEMEYQMDTAGHGENG